MTTTELRNELISRISGIDDLMMLETIKTLLDLNFQDGKLILSDEMKREIEASRKDFEEGNYISDEDLHKEITAWLNEK